MWLRSNNIVVSCLGTEQFNLRRLRVCRNFCEPGWGTFLNTEFSNPVRRRRECLRLFAGSFYAGRNYDRAISGRRP
jgi:hypothetical protein